MKPIYLKTRREQLDTNISNSKDLLTYMSKQNHGWIRTVREALGMTITQLAQRLHIRQPSVSQMENGELDETITIHTLKKAANALGCNLVYGFVPKTSFNQLVEVQALETAKKMIARTSHTMALENQGTNISPQNEIDPHKIKELAEELLRQKPTKIWSKDL